jgi:FkbM family methyltransferase
MAARIQREGQGRMISYAQNHEDVVLARLFRQQDAGFYIDVGAGHPVDDSVTKHFSDAGWRGINVEPMPREHQLLCVERPNDVNLCVALSDYEGHATLYEAPPENRGASTLVPEIAARYREQTFTAVPVPVTTLAQACAAHADGPIDFLKVDVEGSELAVLRGADFDRFRPRVLVVEATEPNSVIASHDAWESLLFKCGYRCTLFDGLNRFYAQHDDAEARNVLSAPANALDDYEPWRWVREVEGSKEHIANLEAAQTAAQRHVENLHDAIRALAAEAHSLQERTARAMP